ncbi:hypothetical protein N865_01895 [Intrasporangium oryzae NRRL B-24470]|uniref:Uncharacterized protein n=1 Tax=Intrasporangium oryzae NRRL B-24470 TaxID=1386089 RepID=W9GH59_9MICO|nr:hypothetical protein [Intrasporangium oryzae]EWT03224.1 hypothetical protein N865_01895 [Intrasporangium oryzae NRRL B-24470]
MRFDELPKSWPTRPVTDPEIFEGVIDLIVTEQSRATGAVYAILCHPDGRLLQPICIDDGGSRPSVETVEDGLRVLLPGAAEQGVVSVVMAIARPGGTRPTARDRRLRAVFETVCGAAGVDLLGVAIAAPGGVVAYPKDRTDDSAA